MKKYIRPAVHAFYVIVAIAVTALADPAVRSFVENHFAAAGAIPIIVAILRAIETMQTGK